MSVRERFCEMLNDPQNIRRLIDRVEHHSAFLPYYPEMLDFELVENASAEREEINGYYGAFYDEPISPHHSPQ